METAKKKLLLKLPELTLLFLTRERDMKKEELEQLRIRPGKRQGGREGRIMSFQLLWLSSVLGLELEKAIPVLCLELNM